MTPRFFHLCKGRPSFAAFAQMSERICWRQTWTSRKQQSRHSIGRTRWWKRFPLLAPLRRQHLTQQPDLLCYWEAWMRMEAGGGSGSGIKTSRLFIALLLVFLILFAVFPGPMCVRSFVWLLATPWTVARQAPLTMGLFSGKNTGVGCHFLLQEIFPTQELNPCLLHLLHWQADSLPPVPSGKPRHTFGKLKKKNKNVSGVSDGLFFDEKYLNEANGKSQKMVLVFSSLI